MSTETIYKLEPHRTMHLLGVDRYGAAGSYWGASATGFSLSGVFRDMADFVVLMLWDADDYFGHYQTTKYLPDFSFAGMVLTFDLQASGAQQLDSVMNQWIPWRSLSYILSDGQPGTIDLASHITKVGGTQSTASANVTVSGTPQLWDKVTLWYQNIAFEYTVQPTPSTAVASVTCSYYNAGGTGTVHTLVINGHTYSYIQLATDSSSDCARGVYLAAMGDTSVSLTWIGYQITVNPAVSNTSISVQASDGTNCYIWRDSITNIASTIAGYINAFNWSVYSLPLTATASGATITVSCGVPGADGNQITLYSTIQSSMLGMTPSVQLSGGVSAATLQVSIDFTALGIDQLRQAWLTVAPQLPNSAAYSDTEFLVQVTNWAVSDPNNVRPLKIAGPGSTRIGSRDAWVTYSGTSWIEESSNQVGGTGWFWKGFAHRASTPGDSVTVQYACQSVHDLYLGTSLSNDRGIVSISIDGGAAIGLDCFVGSVPSGPIVTRRLVAPSVAAGPHTVVITLTSGQHVAIVSTPMWDTASSGHYFYFDFLEAAISSDVMDPAITCPAVMPATDFDTDHTYRLSPERLVWMLSRLGFKGELDHYLGVFWWAQRKRVGGTFPAVTVTFGGTWLSGDSAFITIGGFALGKSVFAGDSANTIAAHFCYEVNEIFTGVWASVSGAVLTITGRTPEWSFTYTQSHSSTAGTMTYTGDLTSGVEGNWMIDDTVTPVINRAVTDWHADFWVQVAAQGWAGAVAAFSMELVNPPDNPTAGAVYAQRFSDGSIVATDTGFGGLLSTQCTFSATVQAYQEHAYAEMAGMMAAAGLVPWLQFGEFLWWYCARVQNQAIGYVSDTAPISIGTATPHGLLTGQGVLTAGVQGNIAANDETTATVVDSTHVTLDGSSGDGTYTAGTGTISGGGMAFYDAYTASAAATVLGRPLASFWTQDDDPTLHAADVVFLAGQLKSHIDAVRTFVLASYPTAKFELLWPYDVCYPTLYWTNDLPYPQGGRLNYAVNLPPAYLTKSGSGLERIKMEGLSWIATYRNFSKAQETVQFPYTVGSWNQADTRYLMPWFNGGCAWQREYLFNVNTGTPNLGMWAFDQLCLMGWPLPLPVSAKRAFVF